MKQRATKLSFRQATRYDIPFLLALRKLSMTEHLEKAGLFYDDEQHLARINEFFEDSFILMLEEQEIGLVKLAQNKESWHLRQFQIMPRYHRKGIGKQVVELLQQKAGERDLPITLNVLLENPAMKLYQRMGFEIVSENKLEFQMRWQKVNH